MSITATFGNLEAAIDASVPGALIEIGNGVTPTEGVNSDGQILVDNDVEVAGLSPATSTVQVVAPTGSEGDARGLFLVEDGVTLTLTDLKLDGSGQPIFNAVRALGSASIDGVAFRDIEFGPYEGTAVVGFGPSSAIDVTNSSFVDVGRIGVFYFGAGTTGTFANNTYVGKGEGDHLDYGVEVNAGASVSITNNAFINNAGIAAPDGSQSAGILASTFFGDGTTLTIGDNTFTNNLNAIVIGADLDDTTTVTLIGTNTINSNVADAAGLVVAGDAVVTGVNDSLAGDAAFVLWEGGEGDNVIEGALLGDFLAGNGGSDIITGNAGDDELYGDAGGDQLNGGTGNDLLDGGTGVDLMAGGEGDDTYVVDDAADSVTEAAGEGTDTVETLVNYTLTSNVENGTVVTTTGTTLAGNGLGNRLTGNAGNDFLNGRGGADTMIGGAGNDTYIVDRTADVVVEAAGEGTDRVLSFANYTLSANVENLALQGSANIFGAGNALNNTIQGNAGNNALNGRGGADAMFGGAGDDLYVVDNAGDRVAEIGSNGNDTVLSFVSRTLSANVENLILGGTNPLQGTGNALDNAITGNGASNRLFGEGGNDTITGGGGADYVTGGAGSDVFVFANLSDSSGTVAAGRDRILDFQDGSDLISLAALDANELVAGDQAFVLDTDGSFSAGEIRQTQVGTSVIVEVNTNNDRAADLSFVVRDIDVANLTAADYIL